MRFSRVHPHCTKETEPVKNGKFVSKIIVSISLSLILLTHLAILDHHPIAEYPPSTNHPMNPCRQVHSEARLKTSSKNTPAQLFWDSSLYQLRHFPHRFVHRLV